MTLGESGAAYQVVGQVMMPGLGGASQGFEGFILCQVTPYPCNENGSWSL